MSSDLDQPGASSSPLSPAVPGTDSAVPYVRFEMACRATCKLHGPQFSDNKKGQAEQQAYIDANWPSHLEDMERVYADFLARQLLPLPIHDAQRAVPSGAPFRANPASEPVDEVADQSDQSASTLPGMR